MKLDHISVSRRMLIWAIGTAMALVGGVSIFAFPVSSIVNFPLYVFLFVGGMIIVVINEVVFGLKKEQLQIDRDETIKNTSKKLSPAAILAICPNCKNRVPLDSKYCLECGTDLQRKK